MEQTDFLLKGPIMPFTVEAIWPVGSNVNVDATAVKHIDECKCRYGDYVKLKALNEIVLEVVTFK